MKNILLSTAVLLSLLTSSYAYELNGDLQVKWTGFKTEKKAPVSGTFNDINLNISKSDDLSTFLKSAKVEITTKSFESKNPARNENIITTLFSLATSKIIEGSISSVDTKNKELTLELIMNEVKNNVTMKYTIEDGKINAKGTIDILNYKMEEPYMKFAQKCASFHNNKSYSDVNIEFTLPYK